MNISILGTGIIYRNEKPHVSSKHGYFPWVSCLDNGELLASFVIAEAFEAVNSDTYVSRSVDMGLTWSAPQPVLTDKYKRLSSNCGRITALNDNQAAAIMVRSDRSQHPDEGLANPENMGFVPTELFLVRSEDNGKTWGEPELINPPLNGPSFEACSPVVTLKDGRWLWPTSTWKGWDGYNPNGMKMIALISGDEGKSWPQYIEVMNGSAEAIIYWEGKIIELSDGRLLSVAWVYDEKKGVDLPNHFTISNNYGETWLKPASTNIQGQTMAITPLPGGKLLTVYRRMDKRGLWLTVTRLENDQWINEQDFLLWGGEQQIDRNNKPENMVHEFNELKFGAPCVTILPDNSVYIAFWCYEKMISNIRWFRIALS